MLMRRESKKHRNSYWDAIFLSVAHDHFVELAIKDAP